MPEKPSNMISKKIVWRVINFGLSSLINHSSRIDSTNFVNRWVNSPRTPILIANLMTGVTVLIDTNGDASNLRNKN